MMMEKNLAMKNLLLRTMMLMATLIGIQNTAWADDSVTVGDVSNTPCAYRTRGESVIGNPTLKLTRFDGGLYGELNNCEVNCAYGNINVICQEDGQNLSISVDEDTGDIVADCVCPINISFTIYNALQDEYHLMVRGRDVGTISFKEHSVVEIDLRTLEQANEEGFDYPVNAQGFWPYEITQYVKPDQNLSESLEIYEIFDQQLSCVFKYYALPCEYSVLDVQAELAQDSALVINVLTDGIPGGNCNRVAHLYFDIVNIMKDSYHLRLNHTILTKDSEDQGAACTVCLYEGDFILPSLGGYVSIPIIDNNDYAAILTSVAPQQLTGADSAAPYYDLQGRRLTGQPQRSAEGRLFPKGIKKGIYIRDGRKVVVD